MSKKTPTANAAVIRKNLLLLKGCYIAFLLLTTVKTVIAPPMHKEPNVVIWVLQMVPLLAFARGIFKDQRRHIAGFCYVLLMYFVFIGANMFVPQMWLYTWPGLILLVVMYTSGMMHVRWTRAGVKLITE